MYSSKNVTLMVTIKKCISKLSHGIVAVTINFTSTACQKLKYEENCLPLCTLFTITCIRKLSSIIYSYRNHLTLYSLPLFDRIATNKYKT